MSAHRYWRLWVPFDAGFTSYCAVSECEMRTASGGSNVATGGTPAASSSYSSGYLPAKAFDGSTGADNGWTSNYDNGQPEWLSYDFGSGNDKDIVEVVLKAPVSGLGLDRLPRAFLFQYSDDNAIWITQRAISGLVWAYSDVKAIDVTPASPIYNRVIAMGNVNKVVTDPPTGEPGSDSSKWHAPLSHRVNVGAPWRLTPHSGKYHIAGSTTSLTFPAARTVHLIEQKSGLIVATQNTGADGVYDFRDIAEGPWTVMGVDNSAQQNNVVFGHITAEAQ